MLINPWNNSSKGKKQSQEKSKHQAMKWHLQHRMHFDLPTFAYRGVCMLPTPSLQEITLTTTMFSHFERSSNPSHRTKKPTFQAKKLSYQIEKNKNLPYKEFIKISTNYWVDEATSCLIWVVMPLHPLVNTKCPLVPNDTNFLPITSSFIPLKLNITRNNTWVGL